jgi:energy-coupling factor transporter ATP-binding protein EcfA2
LTKVFAIEHQISIEEAKELTRHIVQNRANQLLTKEVEKEITNLQTEIEKNIKTDKNNELNKKIYELLKVICII